MKTILVTGGAGFIGSCLVRQWLAEEQDAVVNLDKLTYAGNLDSLEAIDTDPHHLFVCGDIGDRLLVARLLREHRPRTVINFAAESHVDRSIDGPDEFVTTNVLGSYRLLEEVRRYWESLPRPAAKAFRFLQVSTDEVYGSLGPSGSFVETTPYAPSSPYSASKAAFDHFVRAYHHTFGLPTLITNCSNNYGPFQFPEKLIPLMILNAIEGQAFPSTAMGNKYAIGFMSRITVEQFAGSLRRRHPARCTTSAAIVSGPICQLWMRFALPSTAASRNLSTVHASRSSPTSQIVLVMTDGMRLMPARFAANSGGDR